MLNGRRSNDRRCDEYDDCRDDNDDVRRDNIETFPAGLTDDENGRFFEPDYFYPTALIPVHISITATDERRR